MRRVRVLHTGGTLGMTGEPLEPGAFNSQLLDNVPQLTRLADVQCRIVHNLDSSDIGPAHWSAIAGAIAEEHGDWDGFVIVHGTDTMAYTAAALSFALKNLDCPVILTGAQRPLAAVRTDAVRNLLDSVEVATLDIPEVSICFDGLLLRGCRAVKADARSYRAFASPGAEPLAQLGTDVDVGEHVRRPTGVFDCDPRFYDGVGVVYVHPGIRTEAVQRAVEVPGLRGLVIAAYGVGTAPQRDSGVARGVRDAVDSGIEVMVVTQWGGAVDLGAYQNSIALHDAGATAGGEMRIEAAVPKLMHALATCEDRAARQAYLLLNVAGERE